MTRQPLRLQPEGTAKLARGSAFVLRRVAVLALAETWMLLEHAQPMYRVCQKIRHHCDHRLGVNPPGQSYRREKTSGPKERKSGSPAYPR